MTNRYLKPALLFGIVVLTALIYWPGLGGPFLFDDYSNLPQVQVDSLDAVELKDAALTNTSGRLRRPVANLSFALNGYFFGPGAFSFKLINLLIHLASGCLVFLLARKITSLVSRDSTDSLPATVGLITAGIWLLHPIQVSTTMYVVQRMAQLSTLFAFLAALAWLRWRTGLASGSWSRTLSWLGLAGLCVLLSLLSKESGALIPLLLLILESVVFRFGCPAQARPRWATVNGLLIGLPLALGLVYTILHWPNFVGAYVARPFTMTERLLTEINALWHYIGLIFVPRLADMGLYYDQFPITRSLDWWTAVQGVGLLGLLVLAVHCARRQPVLSLGILWFFAGHALESTFIALEPAFEHRNYLSLFGPALVVGFYLPKLLVRTRELRNLVVAGITIVALVVTGLTFARVNSWSSRLEFLQTQVQHHPESFRVNLDLINGAMQADNWEGALRQIEAIRENNPEQPAWPFLRLFVACGRGDLPAAWVRETHEVIKIHGTSKEVVLSIQALTGRKVNRICPAIKIPTLLSFIEHALEDSLIQRNTYLRSLLILQKARLQVLQDDIPSAAASYQAAWRSYPNSVTPLLDLAYLQIALGQYGEADETISIIKQVVDDSLFRIGETWVRDLEARLQRERVSSVDTARQEGSANHD